MRAFKAAAQVLGGHGLWMVYPVAIGLIAVFGSVIATIAASAK